MSARSWRESRKRWHPETLCSPEPAGAESTGGNLLIGEARSTLADMFQSRLTGAGRCRRVVVLAALAGSFACRSTPAPSAVTITADTWAVVDGREIKREDVEKAFKRTRDTAQTLSDDEALTAKLNILNDLIVQNSLLAKAGQL